MSRQSAARGFLDRVSPVYHCELPWIPHVYLGFRLFAVVFASC
jgi:hypothetical protein